MKDDGIRVAACVLCLREASKQLEEIDKETSNAILELAAAIAGKFSDSKVDARIQEMEKIKDELARSE